MNLSFFSKLQFLGFVLLSFLSCKSENRGNEIISDELSAISIYTGTDNAGFLDTFIQHPVLDSLLPLNNTFEPIYTFYSYSDVADIKTKRFIITNKSLALSGNADTTYTLGSSKIEVYKDYFGKGQRILLLTNSIPTKELHAVVHKINQELGVDGGRNYRNLNGEKSGYSDSLERSLKTKFGIHLSIPSNFKVAKVDTHFIWFTAIKDNGGYLSFSVEIKSLEKLSQLETLNGMISERNETTAKYFFNDEGTKMVVSELGSYTPKFRTTTYSQKGMRGWFTEEATIRRGPFGRYYYYPSKNNKMIVLDWFCQGSQNYNEDTRILETIAHSFKVL